MVLFHCNLRRIILYKCLRHGVVYHLPSSVTKFSSPLCQDVLATNQSLTRDVLSTNSNPRQFSEPLYKTEISTSSTPQQKENVGLHVFLEPNIKTELETYGSQKSKLFEPVYKTEICTSCTPVTVNKREVTATVRPLVKSYVRPSSKQTKRHQSLFIGSSVPSAVVEEVEKTTTSTCHTTQKTYPTINTLQSTHFVSNKVY